MTKLLAMAVLLLSTSMPVMAVEIEDHDKMLMDHGDGHLIDLFQQKEKIYKYNRTV